MIEIQNIVTRLERYIHDQNYSGYDPYDYKSAESYHRIISASSKMKKMIDMIDFLFPVYTRKYFKIKPDILFPSVLGYMLESYCLLYRSTHNQTYLNHALNISERLYEMPNKKYPGLSWGLPFSWKSGEKLIPAGTPNIVNTIEIGQGLLELHQITKSKITYNHLLQILLFIQDGLKNTFEDDYSLCKSYTPVDDYQVHNANLLAAAFIAKIGKIGNDPSLIECATKMGMFSVKDQTEEGHLPYYSSGYKKNFRENPDLYHAAYEIRSLYTIYKTTDDIIFKHAFEKYLLFLSNYFFKNGYPVTMKYKGVRIMDIHGCAEAIYCYSILSEFDQKYLKEAYRIAKWTIKKFWHSDQYFKYKIIKFGIFKHQSSIPYIRWGQSVMYRALARFLYQNKLSNEYND